MAKRAYGSKYPGSGSGSGGSNPNWQAKPPLGLERNPKYVKYGTTYRTAYIPIGRAQSHNSVYTKQKAYVFTPKRRQSLLKAGMKRRVFGRRTRSK